MIDEEKKKRIWNKMPTVEGKDETRTIEHTRRMQVWGEDGMKYF